MFGRKNILEMKSMEHSMPVTLEVYAWAAMPVTGMDYGFTGHEHLDIFMLVNMNGRIYDPSIGRFLSPDPVLQFPNFTQGLNPYTYCLNNPLSFVDPSGYSIDWGMTGYQATGAMMTTLLLLSVGVTPAALVGVFLITFVHSTTVAMMQGASIKAAAGYGLTSASMAVYSAAGTASIGDAFKLWVPKKGGMFLKELLIASSHGALQGGIRAAQGGKFEHGFYSGFVSSLGGSFMQANSPNMSTGAQITMAAVIGGTAEKLGGGKFANGAVTGAFVMMLNHLGHDKEGTNQEIESNQVSGNGIVEEFVFESVYGLGLGFESPYGSFKFMGPHVSFVNYTYDLNSLEGLALLGFDGEITFVSVNYSLPIINLGGEINIHLNKASTASFSFLGWNASTAHGMKYGAKYSYHLGIVGLKSSLQTNKPFSPNSPVFYFENSRQEWFNRTGTSFPRR
jgi:RHS repeat-associated protein